VGSRPWELVALGRAGKFLLVGNNGRRDKTLENVA